MIETIQILDGATGTMIQKAGIDVPKIPELLNVLAPETLIAIHEAYARAGSQIVYANTFGASPMKLEGTGYTVEDIVKAGVANARQGAPACLVALDIGPLGQLMEPMGSFSFEDAYAQFAAMVKAGNDADLIVIETMSDLLETKAAVLAAKENSELPVYVTMSFEENGRTFTGCTLESMAMTLEGLGVDALGFNCSIGPDGMVGLVKRLARLTSLPIIAKPNAGLPDPATGAYTMDADSFAASMEQLVEAGASRIGGCCGADPSFIERIARWKGEPLERADAPSQSKVCTPLMALELNTIHPVGERINPTGKKRFQQALLEEDLDYIVSIALAQKEAGAQILDVNVGFPGVDEVDMMRKVVKKLQSVVDVPLLLDSSNPAALAAGARVYNGKPALNSVSGEQAKLDAVLPIAKKYGASMVALTLDERGIPATANERIAIAERIVEWAKQMGIDACELWFDPLTMTLSAQPAQAQETLKAVESFSKRGWKTVLGVSNISFGLPQRPAVTRVFLAQALAAGLTMPILNVNVDAYMDTIACARLIRDEDSNAKAYIARFGGRTVDTVGPDKKTVDLQAAIVKGLDQEAKDAARRALASLSALDVVEKELIPALDEVGNRYEKGTLFLPQLLAAAQSAQAVFEVVKNHLANTGQASVKKGKIVLATVQGDIHDIGKNIVKTVLENYGYDVIDLGRDVAPETVVEAVARHGVKLVGLSALMTTTLPAMQETIRQLHTLDNPPKIMVGGAVLTPAYARDMQADYYSKDAQDGVRIAREVFDHE